MADGGRDLKSRVASACTEGKQWRVWNSHCFTGFQPENVRLWLWCVLFTTSTIEFYNIVALFRNIRTKFGKILPSKRPKWLLWSRD